MAAEEALRDAELEQLGGGALLGPCKALRQDARSQPLRDRIAEGTAAICAVYDAE